LPATFPILASLQQLCQHNPQSPVVWFDAWSPRGVSHRRVV